MSKSGPVDQFDPAFVIYLSHPTAAVVLWAVYSIATDCGCECAGCTAVSAICVANSNTNLLSSCETGVNPDWTIRSWKKHLSDQTRCQRAIAGTYFTIKQWRAEVLQPGLEMDNFKRPCKMRYLQIHILAEQLFLESGNWGGFWRGELRLI